MKKKYSDPLMFSAVLLSDIPVTTSIEPTPGPDNEGDDGVELPNGLTVNSLPGIETTEPLTIVNPVEEAVNSEDTTVTDAPAAETPSPLEVEPIIDSLVPEETASAEVGE